MLIDYTTTRTNIIALQTAARSTTSTSLAAKGTIAADTEDVREVAGDIIMDIYEAVTVFLANFATD